MPAPDVILGVVAAVVVVAVVLVVVLVLRRRARARSAEPVVRRIELAGSASRDIGRRAETGAASAPAFDPLDPLAPLTPPSAPASSGADRIAPAAAHAVGTGFFTPEADGTAPPMAPILHFDTVEVSTIEPAWGPAGDAPTPASPSLIGAGTAGGASAPAAFADETVIVRSRGAEDVFADPDATVVSERRRAAWYLETQNGQRIELPAPLCIVGRRPHPVATHPSAVLVAVDDPGKTVSGTHALFELVDGAWLVTDLDSTNGVVILVGGFETAIPTRTRTRIEGDFYLGDLGVRILRES